MSACVAGSLGIVQVLISKNANLDTPNNDGGTAIYYCGRNGHTSCLKALITAGADVQSKDKDSGTALYVASCNDHPTCVELLVNAGADVNVVTTDEYGDTALWNASFHGHDACVDLLIKAGAYVDIQNTTGSTPMYNACQNGHLSCIKLLHKAGCDLSLRCNVGLTPISIDRPIHFSCLLRLKQDSVSTFQCPHKDYDCDTSLATAFSNPSRHITSGRSPIQVAAAYGHVSCVEYLLHTGLEFPWEGELSPLTEAIAEKQGKVTDLLMAYKLDKSLSTPTQ